MRLALLITILNLCLCNPCFSQKVRTAATSPIWKAEYDNATDKEHLKKLRQVDSRTTIKDLISVLNHSYPKIPLVYKKISKDTLYVAIPHSEVLTEQMGTTGSSEYITVATNTLTEFKGIRYVNFDFQEGEHATPGTFTRINDTTKNDFWIIIK